TLWELMIIVSLYVSGCLQPLRPILGGDYWSTAARGAARFSKKAIQDLCVLIECKPCLSWFAQLLTLRFLLASCSFICPVGSWRGRALLRPQPTECRRSPG